MSHDFAKSHRIKREATRKKPVRKSGGVPSWLWLLIGTLTGGLIMFLVYLSGIAPQLPQLAPPTQQAQTTAPAATQPSTAVEPAAPPKRTSPVFEFYTKLPEGGQTITDIPPGAQQAQNPPAANPAETVAPAVTTPSATTPSATTPAPVANVPPPAAEPLDPIQQLLAQQEQEKQQAAKQQNVTKTAAPITPATTANTNTSGKMYLQAGVFRNRTEADKLRSKITSLGLKSSTQTTTNAAGETLQKVIVGPFSSKADQEDASIILTGNKINAFPLK